MIDERLEVQMYLRRLSEREIRCLAIKHKILTSANKSQEHLVEELRQIPAVQEAVLV